MHIYEDGITILYQYDIDIYRLSVFHLKFRLSQIALRRDATLGEVFELWCFINTLDIEEIVSLFRSPFKVSKIVSGERVIFFFFL